MAKNNDVVIINLGGRDRELRFGHKALKNFQAISNIGLEEIGQGGFDLETIEKLIYCGLLSDARKQGENLKLEDMEDWLDEVPEFNKVVDKMTLALSNAFGTAKEDPNSKRVAPAKK
jgi:hypothetical protein